MINLKDKRVLILDFGNYIGIARRLAKDFGSVFYWNPTDINGFRQHNPVDIGRNVPNVIKVDEWQNMEDEIDLFVFPDIYMTGAQAALKSRGKLVFGSGYGQVMETDRGWMKSIQKEIGLPINNYEEVTGVHELEERLKLLNDKYIKSTLRGDMESFHHINYTLSKEELKGLAHRMGIYDRKEKYIIEDPIESISEVGIDTMVVNGEYLEESLTGIELKDTGFYGRIVKYSKLPKQIKDVTDKLSNWFKIFDYNGPYSNEIRIDKKLDGYLIDQTNRFPSPPTSLMMLMYDNFSEVVWQVANGIVPKVKYHHEHGVQLIIKSEQAKTEPVAILFPKEYEDNIDIKNLVIDDYGVWYYTQNNIEMCEIGSVSATGRTMEEAVNKATKIANSIEGFDIKINTDCIDDAKKQIATLKKNGINYL